MSGIGGFGCFNAFKNIAKTTTKAPAKEAGKNAETPKEQPKASTKDTAHQKMLDKITNKFHLSLANQIRASIAMDAAKNTGKSLNSAAMPGNCMNAAVPQDAVSVARREFENAQKEYDCRNNSNSPLSDYGRKCVEDNYELAKANLAIAEAQKELSDINNIPAMFFMNEASREGINANRESAQNRLELAQAERDVAKSKQEVTKAEQEVKLLKQEFENAFYSSNSLYSESGKENIKNKYEQAQGDLKAAKGKQEWMQKNLDAIKSKQEQV